MASENNKHKEKDILMTDESDQNLTMLQDDSYSVNQSTGM